MYALFLVLTTAALVSPQNIDPSVLCEVFGPPDGGLCQDATSLPVVDKNNIDQVTVKPTDKPTILIDKDGDQCKCVPYYLCDADLVAVNYNNASVTGWGELDIRFGEDDSCQESVERCCKNPKKPEEVPSPVPDASRLRGCGYANPKGLDFTIKGGSGSEAQFGEFPWVIAVLDARNNSYAGVGVLIHPQVVLTGAHIASKYQIGELQIRAGEWDTQTNGERLPHQSRLVQEILIHPEFRKKTLWFDAALLRLKEPLELADHINVICLPSQDENFETNKNCVANGWGKDVFGQQGRYSVILKKVEQDMVSHSRCDTLLKRTRLGPRFKLHNTFVCAGGEEGIDTCQGDGGAPLTCPIGESRYKLTGLVAWGIGCGQKDVPAVYAAVAKFRAWIDESMANWGYDTNGYNIH